MSHNMSHQAICIYNRCTCCDDQDGLDESQLNQQLEDFFSVIEKRGAGSISYLEMENGHNLARSFRRFLKDADPPTRGIHTLRHTDHAVIAQGMEMMEQFLQQ